MKMKRFIYLLALVLINTNIFGQQFEDFSPNCSEIKAFAISDMIARSDLFYSFVANNVGYALLYRMDSSNKTIEKVNYTDENGYGHTQKELVLYRHDETGKWIEASNIVQTDSIYPIMDKDFGTHKSYGYCNDFLMCRKWGHGQVHMLNNGWVVMLLGNSYSIAKYNYDDTYKYISIAILVPNGDGTYTATRFEPLNRETIQPELCPSDTLKIIESGIGIKLEFWNKMISGKNEKFATMNFNLMGNDIHYSGSYNLIQSK
jgi:hypothetical protein